MGDADLTVIRVGTPLIDAADPPPGYTAPACPLPGTHGQLEPTGLAAPFTYVCRTHLDQAVLTLGSPADRPITICTACEAGDPRPYPYGVVRAWPARTFHPAGSHLILACRHHLTDALTALM